ncbi:unnamed protein product [Paramecium primaurelia]|uniref:P-loop containing nucleoside triphosphate hydrolase n=1 Tax=Paramecium primaurelia TaxID=5886 RepID=A0A8S1QG35_PARPR|nr:unnamed protein product [Paramecium primaurelia]
MSEKNPISIKLIVLGDANVGKVDILLSYIKDQISQDFIPKVFENYTITTVVDGKKINLSLWDTAGQETYNRLRILSYGQADVFLIVFSIIDEQSFQNAVTKWYQDVEVPELKNVPKIFVGNNKDQRNLSNPSHVQYEAAKSKIDQLQCQYLECSSQTQEGIKEVFDQAIKKVLQVKGQKSESTSSKNQNGSNQEKEKCLIF